jgi:UDP-N-acetylglucosamine 2-epimerase (non-hydrolysing)
MGKQTLAIVLGIRPDVIRASIMLDLLRASGEHDVIFIWSGQHYSDNLKDVFFREMDIKSPDIELQCGGDTDAAIASSVISNVYDALSELRPAAVVFLGDTNTVMGAIAAGQLNIPVVHIEGCMRSYDWRMPEEKYRTVIDNLSDVIYAYFDEYKEQGVREGINPDSIVVTGNPIVDVLNKYYYDQAAHYDQLASPSFFNSRSITNGEFYLMTCHRRENVHEQASLENILSLVGQADRQVYFPASYRTQRVLSETGLVLPDNLLMVDPVGYQEFLLLLTRSHGVITDSGTVVEEACVLQVPALQMRKSTERPQVYDVGACVKYDPAMPENYPQRECLDNLENLWGKTWENPLGDGKSSQRIVSDLLERLYGDGFGRHKPDDYHHDIRRSYRNDGL